MDELPEVKALFSRRTAREEDWIRSSREEGLAALRDRGILRQEHYEPVARLRNALHAAQTAQQAPEKARENLPKLLETASLSELRAALRKQQDLLKCKPLIEKLPDKGEKIRKKIEELESAIATIENFHRELEAVQQGIAAMDISAGVEDDKEQQPAVGSLERKAAPATSTQKPVYLSEERSMAAVYARLAARTAPEAMNARLLEQAQKRSLAKFSKRQPPLFLPDEQVTAVEEAAVRAWDSLTAAETAAAAAPSANRRVRDFSDYPSFFADSSGARLRTPAVPLPAAEEFGPVKSAEAVAAAAKPRRAGRKVNRRAWREEEEEEEEREEEEGEEEEESGEGDYESEEDEEGHGPFGSSRRALLAGSDEEDDWEEEEGKASEQTPHDAAAPLDYGDSYRPRRGGTSWFPFSFSKSAIAAAVSVPQQQQQPTASSTRRVRFADEAEAEQGSAGIGLPMQPKRGGSETGAAGSSSQRVSSLEDID